MLESLQKRYRLAQLWKQSLICLERRSMHASARSANAHGMFQMQHLVIQQVFDGVTRRRGPVKHTADHDSIMSRIVVTQQSLGVVLTPSKLRPPKQAMKEATIE